MLVRAEKELIKENEKKKKVISEIKGFEGYKLQILSEIKKFEQKKEELNCNIEYIVKIVQNYEKQVIQSINNKLSKI